MGFVRRNGDRGEYERPDQYKIFGLEGIQMRKGAVEGVSSLPLEGKTNDELVRFTERYNEAHRIGPQYWGKSFSMIGGKANPVQVQVGGKGVGKGKDKHRDGKGPRS